MDDTLGTSAALNRAIRQDTPLRLGEPTVPRLLAAVNEGKPERALEWFDYLHMEHRAIHDLFGVWNWHMAGYYLDRVGEEAWPALVQASLVPWIATTVGYPDAVLPGIQIHGRSAILSVAELPWHLHLVEASRCYGLTLGTAREQEERWATQRNSLSVAMQDGAVERVQQGLDSHLEELRLIHDVLCDWAWALLTVIAASSGEESLGDVLRVTEEPWVASRYERLRNLGVQELLELTVEGMRGHFSGPNRSGSIEIVEESDRYILQFDACGTGGRMRRGDPLVGSGSRLVSPYNFLNIAGSYDWTWGRKGVCAYCAHCAVVNQILPIEGMGFPMRMTLYPENPDDPCHWVIYKDRTKFPDEAFRAVGKDKPA